MYKARDLSCVSESLIWVTGWIALCDFSVWLRMEQTWTVRMKRNRLHYIWLPKTEEQSRCIITATYYMGRCARITWADVHILHGKMYTYYMGRCAHFTWEDVHALLCNMGRCAHITLEDVHLMFTYYMGICSHITWGDVHILHGKMCSYYMGRCSSITW